MAELQTPVADLQTPETPAERTPLRFTLSVLLQAVDAKNNNGICVDLPEGRGGGNVGNAPAKVAEFILKHLQDWRLSNTHITLTHRLLDRREIIRYAQVPDAMWKDIQTQLATLFHDTPWTLVESPVSAQETKCID